YAGVAKCVQMQCGDEKLPLEDWVRHKRLLDDWIKQFPNSLTAKLARAVYAKEYAWYARGTGYASTVPPEAWTHFRERIEEARLLLEDIKVDAASDPEWYAAMLSIALTQSWPATEFDALFREGSKK